MEKVIYWLKKLGIVRTGAYKIKGDGKKMAEMEVKGELYQSDAEIEKESAKKSQEAEIKPVSKKKKNLVGKIIFWIFVAIGVFFLLAFWATGLTFGIFIGIIAWGFFLRWTWVHITSGLLAIGKIIVIGLVIIVFSFVVATPEEDGMGVSVEMEKTGEKSDSELAKDVKSDTVTKFLLELKKSTKLDLSKIENDELSWPGKTIQLKLNKVKSFKAKNLSAKDFDKLQKYFLDKDSTDGGLGFTFVPPAGTQSSGFALTEEEYSGMMCVLVAIEDEGVGIGCGWGPTSNPNSK